MKKTFISLSMMLIVILALTGCYEWPDNIFDPDDTGLTTPTITGVDKTTLLGGIDQLTITGSGFGTVANEVLIYFKKGTTVGRGRALNVTDTEIIVEAPAVYSDSLEIWIDRRGCFEYAKFTSSLITIESGIKALPIVTVQPLNQVAINEDGDIIVALGSSFDVLSFTIDDSLTTIAGVSFSNSLNILAVRTTGDDIYYTLREYIVKYDGAKDRNKVNAAKNNLNDFAFANNNKIYLVAANYIYSTDHDMSNAADAVVDTNYNYTKCEVYDGNLYVASTYVGGDTLRANEKAIMTYPINTNGSLGTGEMLINWTEDFAGSIIKGLSFDANGTMYVATSTSTPIYVFEPVAGSYADGSISLLYPVLLNQAIISMRWDSGDYMAFIAKDASGARTVYRLKMIETASPNYIP